MMPFPRLRALSGSYSNFFRPFENRKRTKDYDDVATHLKINKVLDKGLLFVDRQSTLTWLLYTAAAKSTFKLNRWNYSKHLNKEHFRPKDLYRRNLRDMLKNEGKYICTVHTPILSLWSTLNRCYRGHFIQTVSHSTIMELDNAKQSPGREPWSSG